MLLVGHHDTVFPLGSLASRPFAVTTGKATGPGVFDMKGGIVQAIHGLAALDDLDGVEMLITADEEVGSIASRALIEERAHRLRGGARARTERRRRALKTGRKGTGTFEVTSTAGPPTPASNRRRASTRWSRPPSKCC